MAVDSGLLASRCGVVMAPSIPLLMFKRGEHPSQSALAALVALLQQLAGEIGGEHGEPGQPTGRGHIPTVVGDDGRIQTPDGLAPRDLSDAIKRYWPESIWTDAARVAYIESAGWNRTAERNTLDRAGGRCNVPIGTLSDGTPIVSEQSVGYYQINVCAHGHDRDYWTDADNNVRYARRLYDESGWHPWTVTAKKLGLLGG